ncbi:MAG: hypothetical protein D6701_03985 [Gemmatimonadetes bacterium]|nr:MAG: hypothetical protein D6701_03985 [Gemmatimonadota bacterium]
MHDRLMIAGAPLLTSAVVAGIFLYLYRRSGERYLAFWALAWVLWAGRYLLAFAEADASLAAGGTVLAMLAVGRAVFVLWGASSMLGRPFPVWAALALTTDAAYQLALGFATPRGVWWAVPHYAILSVALIAAGLAFARRGAEVGAERFVAAVAFVLFGLLQLAFPFVSDTPPWSTLGQILASTLQTTAALGVLLVYFRRAQLQRDRLVDQLERALSGVLGERLSVCASCKAVKGSDGHWTPIDEFARRSGAPVSHGLCPRCVAEFDRAEGFPPEPSTSSAG